VPDGSLAAVTDHLEMPESTPEPDVAAQPEAADVVAELEWLAARLDSAEQPDSMPLTELAEQLAALHNRLQSALSELDRT
jgi:hypothetical protein